MCHEDRHATNDGFLYIAGPKVLAGNGVKGDDGLSRSLVQVVGRNGARHGGDPRRPNPVDYRIPRAFQVALPHAGRYPKTRIRRALLNYTRQESNLQPMAP